MFEQKSTHIYQGNKRYIFDTHVQLTSIPNNVTGPKIADTDISQFRLHNINNCSKDDQVCKCCKSLSVKFALNFKQGWKNNRCNSLFITHTVTWFFPFNPCIVCTWRDWITQIEILKCTLGSSHVCLIFQYRLTTMINTAVG